MKWKRMWIKLKKRKSEGRQLVNITLKLRSRFPVSFFPSGFPTTIFSKFSICPVRAACTFSVFLF